jgi:hypothetical protein
LSSSLQRNNSDVKEDMRAIAMKKVADSNKDNTCIAIWKSTKDKLDKNRAPGQCYNGFICQLIDFWEKRG